MSRPPFARAIPAAAFPGALYRRPIRRAIVERGPVPARAAAPLSRRRAD